MSEKYNPAVDEEIKLVSFKKALEHFEEKYNVYIEEIDSETGGFSLKNKKFSHMDDNFFNIAKDFAKKILNHLEETNGILPKKYKFSKKGDEKFINVLPKDYKSTEEGDDKSLVGESYCDVGPEGIDH